MIFFWTMKHKRTSKLKIVLFIILLATAGTVVFGSKLPFKLPEPLNTWSKRFNPSGYQLTELGDSIDNINLGNWQTDLSSLGERSQVIQETVSQIAAEAVKTDEADKPLTEKALEYGRYLYCKQVVEDWEKPNQ